MKIAPGKKKKSIASDLFSQVLFQIKVRVIRLQTATKCKKCIRNF